MNPATPKPRRNVGHQHLRPKSDVDRLEHRLHITETSIKGRERDVVVFGRMLGRVQRGVHPNFDKPLNGPGAAEKLAARYELNINTSKAEIDRLNAAANDLSDQIDAARAAAAALPPAPTVADLARRLSEMEQRHGSPVAP